MTDFEEKLRLLGVKRGVAELKKTPDHSPKNRIQDVVSGSILSTPYGDLFISEKFIPVHQFLEKNGQFFANDMKIISDWAKIEFEIKVQLEDLCFIDTETTGLSGGTGTYIFLAGTGVFEAGHFHLIQFFMRDPTEEPALLFALEELLTRCSGVVTFNGKSFDVPLLKSRYLMNGWKEPLSNLYHIDLLHLSRKLWRDRLPSRSLPNIEAHILGIVRTEEDIPGWMVPQIYLDYIRDGDATPLKNVFYHNFMDVVSLAHLLNYLNGYLLQNDTNMDHGLDIFSLARFYEDLGYSDTAINLYSLGLTHEDFKINDQPDKPYLEALNHLAFLYKRKNEYTLAIEFWEKATAYQYLPAFIELAKIFEHSLRNYQEAIRWTDTAIKCLDQIQLNHYERKEWSEELEHRLNRLKKKVS
jgi:hypothetical protein